MSYEHFKSFQRNELSILLQAKVKKKDIAKLLNKNRTSVWREIQRNKIRIGSKKRFRKNINCYDAGEAKKKTVIRRIKANQRFRKIENNNWLKRYIIKKIKLYWSPDEISGRLEREYKNDKTKWIGKDSIYQFIYTEHPNLVKYLRHQKCKYRRKHGTNIRAKRREEAKKNELVNDQ